MGAAGLNASEGCGSVQEADVMVMVSCQRKGVRCLEVRVYTSLYKAANTFGRAAAGTSMNTNKLPPWCNGAPGCKRPKSKRQK